MAADGERPHVASDTPPMPCIEVFRVADLLMQQEVRRLFVGRAQGRLLAAEGQCDVFRPQRSGQQPRGRCVPKGRRKASSSASTNLKSKADVLPRGPSSTALTPPHLQSLAAVGC